MARSRKADESRMVPVKEGGRAIPGLYRRGENLIVRVWDPSKNGKGGKVNRTVQIAKYENLRAAIGAAKDLKREMESEVRDRVAAGNGAQETVRSWAGKWQDVVPRDRSEPTRTHNAERVKAFVEDFGDWTLQDVARNKTACQVWIVGGPVLKSVEELARGWRGARADGDGVVVPGHRGNLPAVRAMFTDARSVGLLGALENPFSKMGLKQARGRRDIVVVTEDEEARLEAIAGEQWGVYGRYVYSKVIRAAAFTGLRPGELFGLWPEHVDLERRVIVENGRKRVVHPGDLGYEDAVPAPVINVVHQLDLRHGKVRYAKTEGRDDAPVPCLPEAEEVFRELEIDRLPQQEPIFRTTHGKLFRQKQHHYYWDPVRRAFVNELPEEHHLRRRMREAQEAKARAGKVPTGVEGNLDFYELRHFFGSRLADAGMSPYDIAKAMGHSDGGKTAMEYYIHTDAEDAADRVLQAFRRAA